MTYQTDGTGAAITTINAPTVPVLAAADTALLPILDSVLTTKRNRRSGPDGLSLEDFITTTEKHSWWWLF
jgi:hypothetical protein